MTILSLSDAPAAAGDGPRPVNLRTDLAPLADLIELVFAHTMDQGGAAAVRELRALSRLGPGLSMFPNANDLLLGISMGYVWIAGGRLVGNVSVYPANWPRSLGSAWIIANVGVHPDYRGRGIAARLMRATMGFVRQRGGTAAVLQVDTDNAVAHRLYLRLGFHDERAFTLWRRSGSLAPPARSSSAPVFITRRRPAEWRAEYALAQRVRPPERGGLGWQRPLHADLFHPPLLRRALDWLNLRALERLVVRAEDQTRLLAALWIEHAALVSGTQLTLLVDPASQGVCDDALLHLAVRRFSDRRGALLIEHPSDETGVADTLQRYHFRAQRQVTHMRWDVR